MSTQVDEVPTGTDDEPRHLWRDLGRHELLNGLVGLLFSVSGPVAIILAVAARGGLSAGVTASWIFGILTFNGLLTVVASLVTRMPLGFFWTIPGTVVVGQALPDLAWSEVIGAYLLAALLMLAIGLTGQVNRLMNMLPMPIVMAMVAGIFLSFGTDLVTSVKADVLLGGPMAAAFVLSMAVPRLGAVVPPVLAALLAGMVMVAVTGGLAPGATDGAWLVQPVFTAPTFTMAATVELVLPLVITVLVVQNGQGLAVLSAAGHRPPMNAVTICCGITSLAAAGVGAISTCLTGPTNALLTATGRRERHYAAAVVCGTLAVLTGILAPGVVRLMQSTPEAFLIVLGGLAMLKALQGAFVAAFSGGHVTGALVTFLVTVADFTLLNIGAAFWGLVAGVLVTMAVDRRHP